eukprot:scpid93197/ scgid16084/ Synaptogyrin-3
MSETQGFGSGGSGGGGASARPQEDIVEVLRKPQSWIRIAALVCSIIVFGTIASNGQQAAGCVFNAKDSACDFGIAVGVIAFLACLFFLVMDFALLVINKQELVKHFLLLDLVFSALWGFMWFVCFCFLTNEWRVAKTGGYSTAEKNAGQSAIAFSFFSIVAWVALAVLGFLAFRKAGGVGAGYSDLGAGGAGGASSPLARDDAMPYQEAPPGDDPEKPVY